jgi:hypothetical protein
LPVAIHGMMPARAERGDGSEEKKSLLDIESEGKLTVNRWGMPRMGLWSSRRRIAVPTRHVTKDDARPADPGATVSYRG